MKVKTRKIAALAIVVATGLTCLAENQNTAAEANAIRETLQIISEKAMYNPVTKEFTASGNVVITKKDGSAIVQGEKVVINSNGGISVSGVDHKIILRPVSTPLDVAVERFNIKAAKDPIGHTQPPLTVDEVLAAIVIIPSGHVPEGLSAEDLDAYKKIAETKTLPPGSDIEATSGFTVKGSYSIRAWDVRLRMILTSDPEETYAWNIRKHLLGFNK